jgi:hypothetical protein
MDILADGNSANVTAELHLIVQGEFRMAPSPEAQVIDTCHLHLLLGWVRCNIVAAQVLTRASRFTTLSMPRSITVVMKNEPFFSMP